MLADVVGASGAVKVIPEVVPEHWEEDVVLLNHGEAVLALEVVGLAIGPVKPGDGLVHVRPDPVAWGALAVSLLYMNNEAFNHF